MVAATPVDRADVRSIAACPLSVEQVMPSARNGLLVRGARRAALWIVAAGACTGIGEVASAQVTLSAGGGVGIDTRQPGLALRIVVQTETQLGSGVPLRMFAFSPGFMSEWPSADGRLLSRANNPDLFSMLGTTYGSTTRATSRSRTCAAWR